MKTIQSILRFWLPIAAAVTMVCLINLITVQQTLRLGANDPQIQMAEDAASNLANGAPVDAILPPWKIDISKSLAPFLMIFDKDGGSLGSSGMILNTAPEIPAGVLKNALDSGQNPVTWQPQSGLRYAIVVVPISGGPGGYVLAGRSLREVEKRENLLYIQVLVGWLGTIVATLGLVVVVELINARKKRLPQ